MIVGAALLGVFALVFRDYRTDHFISAGIACLLTGLLLAIPAALLSWLLLARGFAVNPVAAGLAGGALAGLCGVTMLELHCANFQALHVLVWHTAVVPLSAALGALVAWALSEYSTRRLQVVKPTHRPAPTMTVHKSIEMPPATLAPMGGLPWSHSATRR